MEFLKKIHPNLVILLIVVLGIIILANLNIISFFGKGKGEKDIIIQEYVTNKKLDSLIQIIQSNQEVIENYNIQIKEYQTSIAKIDYKITKNQNELGKIAKEYEKNVDHINTLNSGELYQYFSNRYN